MAEDFNNPPIYDPITQEGAALSDVYQIWLAEFAQNVAAYLTSLGIFVPQVTDIQRYGINNPQNGMMIYNTTIDAPQIFQGGIWKTFTTL